ncbi:hypothetical protein QTN94_18190 [Vibrio sp. M250220]|uniref:hypothetical protein n=1 Tax=Vibrio sp. M250220 TaxID=3020894 RepID=UPI002F408C7E
MKNRTKVLILCLVLNSKWVAGVELDSIDIGLGLGVVYSGNLCDNSIIQCKNSEPALELQTSFNFGDFIVSGSIVKSEEFYAKNEKNENHTFSFENLSLTPKYAIDLNDHLSLYLGAGGTIWKDLSYGKYQKEHIGTSIHYSFGLTRYLTYKNSALHLNLSVYPNYLGTSSDLLFLNLVISKPMWESNTQKTLVRSSKIFQKPQTNAINIFQKNTYNELKENNSIILFNFNSTQIEKPKQVDKELDSYQDGDKFLIYGHRSFDEDIIISIERAKKIRDILLKKFPNSEISIINISRNSPLSSAEEGVAEERRVIVKVIGENYVR